MSLPFGIRSIRLWQTPLIYFRVKSPLNDQFSSGLVVSCITTGQLILVLQLQWSVHYDRLTDDDVYETRETAIAFPNSWNSNTILTHSPTKSIIRPRRLFALWIRNSPEIPIESVYVHKLLKVEPSVRPTASGKPQRHADEDKLSNFALRTPN